MALYISNRLGFFVAHVKSVNGVMEDLFVAAEPS